MTTTMPEPVFIDTETTSLRNPWITAGRRPWEIALLSNNPAEDGNKYRVMQLLDSDVGLVNADAIALNVGGYWERKDPGISWTPERTARIVHELTLGRMIVAANPRFDMDTLEAFLHRAGLPASWHYIPFDVEAATWGRLGRYVKGLSGCADALGIEHSYDLHTAYGDAALCRDIYNHLMGGTQ